MLASFLLPILAGGTPPARLEASTTPVITVHIYNVGSAGERDILELEQTATEIFNHAGIEMVWMNCSTVCAQYSGVDGLAGRSGETVVWLRVVDRLDRSGEHALGWTSPHSSAVTVQYNRAREMAHASPFGLSSGEILGHVAAHEIGHVLLRTTTHSLFGIMKSTYNERDLLKMVQGRLLFSVEESRVLGARLGSVSGPEDKNAIPIGSQVHASITREATMR